LEARGSKEELEQRLEASNDKKEGDTPMKRLDP